jgi:ABC-type nitrate/sulfonate/bicarbonate transport system substrate-binding protein
MQRISAGALLLIFLSLPRISAIAAESLRAASGGFTAAIHAILWAAYEEKIFRKYGLDVEYLALNTGRLGMQMLLSDDIRILFSTGVTVVTTNLQKADLAVIAGGLNFFPTKLVARPEIKNRRISRVRFSPWVALAPPITWHCWWHWKSWESIRRK